MNKELTVQEAALAWAQGKRVEAADKLDLESWKRVDAVGVDNPDSRTCYAGVFNRSHLYRFRLAPEPPAKRYRPWTPDEVPVGALIRFKDWSDGCRLMICGAWNGGVMWSTAEGVAIKPPETLLSDWEHSTDNGKTWLPCGVEVEAEP